MCGTIALRLEHICLSLILAFPIFTTETKRIQRYTETLCGTLRILGLLW